MNQTKLPTNIVFCDDQYLKMYGLHIGDLIDGYFKNSSFYDNTCINNQLIMKNQDKSLLTQLDGISYRLSLVQLQDGQTLIGDDLTKPENQAIDILQALAVIDKVYHESGADTEDTLQAKYYVVNACIYQAPDIYSLITSKIRNSIFYLRESIREFNKLFKWDIEAGFYPTYITENDENAVLTHEEYNSILRRIDEVFKMQNQMLTSLFREMELEEPPKK